MAAELQPKKSNLKDNSETNKGESSIRSYVTSSTAMTDGTTSLHGSEKITTPRKVQFYGVAVRVFNRSLGDNPSAEGGPPLALGWRYTDLTRETSSIASSSISCASTNSLSERSGSASESDLDPHNGGAEVDPSLPPPTDNAIFPIDDYEAEAERHRMTKLLEVLRLREKSQIQYKKMQRTLQRQAVTGSYFKDPHDEEEENDPDLLSVEQMNQLSAKWLKIQPLSGKKREKILLMQTETTKAEIDKRRKELFRLRNQRNATRAMSETGLDDFQLVAETLKRRFRRFRSGISKQQEQDLLWEKAREHFRRKENGEVRSEAVE